MRKKILYQIAAIIAVFMIALLVIIEVAISHSSTRLFTDAKEELLSRDLGAITEDMFVGNYVRRYAPELMNYCRAHLDDVGLDVLNDPDFLAEYKRVIPGLLERYGVGSFEELYATDFPEFSGDEQAVYARLWYYFLRDYINEFQKYYGFSAIAIIDVSESGTDRVFCCGAAENGLDRETLESVVADENERNGTFGKIAKAEEAQAEFGVAYSGKSGNWLVGYYPIMPMTETSRYAVCIATDLKQFNHTLTVQLAQILVFGFVVIAVFFALLIWFLNRRMVHPVTQIQKSVRRYTDDKDAGQIMADMEKVRLGNEIGILAGDISNLAEEMERHTRENLSLVAEQERINTEMNLARDIQASALPSRFPAFPERDEFDLYASMHAAKEVGGDFYDFFLVDPDHLALVIADVSGKGIPAALFMMTAKTLIKNQLMAGISPAEALARVNLQLCERNESKMFVTVWAALLEISTGRGLACNAGHENPGVRRQDGPFELLEYRHDMFLGVSRKAKYADRPFGMKPGDSLFVYTDGVPEAKNGAREMFGDERLAAALNREADAAPEELIGNVQRAVSDFVQDAPQFDDITMLSFRYYGPRNQGTDA